MTYKTIESCVGKTPLVRLQRMNKTNNEVLLKLEGDNPAGSVKDRPAMNMIKCAEEGGQIKPGDTLIEATSGNTGIALAMSAAIRGYKMILIMPENMSKERRAMMKAFGSEIVLVSEEESMEGARDLALQLQSQGKGVVLLCSVLLVDDMQYTGRVAGFDWQSRFNYSLIKRRNKNH